MAGDQHGQRVAMLEQVSQANNSSDGRRQYRTHGIYVHMGTVFCVLTDTSSVDYCLVNTEDHVTTGSKWAHSTNHKVGVSGVTASS